LERHQATWASNISPAARGLSFKFGTLARFPRPDFVPPERKVAEVEGWILGVDGAHAGVRGPIALHPCMALLCSGK
jgi:hypothetical protein